MAATRGRGLGDRGRLATRSHPPRRRARPAARRRTRRLLDLQRTAGNAAATAAIEEATADRAKADNARAEAVRWLYDDVEEGRDHLVMATCHAWANERELLQSLYLAAHRRPLRDHIVSRMGPTETLVRILACLHSGDDTDPYAQMGLSVIPSGTADDLILTLVEKRPLSARRELADDYRKAFKGVHKRGDALLQHLFDKGIAEWRFQKVQALIDHDLTKAEHLHFVMTSSAGLQAGNAIDIIEEVWDQGPPAFGPFFADWDHWVKGNGWVELGLREACMDKLGGDQRQRAQAVFMGWTQANDKHGGSGPDHGAVSSAAHVALLEALGIVGMHKMDGAAVVKAASLLRANKEAEIKKDPSMAKAWSDMRPSLEKAVRETLADSVGGLFGDSDAMTEATVNLRRRPTAVDKAYFAMRKHDEKGVLAAVAEGWLAGIEATMEYDALHPPAGDPRPQFSILEKGVPSGSDHWPKVMALLTPSGDHLSRGAARLSADLKGGLTTTASSDLKEAYAFLQTMKLDRALMEGVISKLFGDLDHFDFFLHRFERSVLRKDVLNLVFPDKNAKERLASAKEREAASHTGVLDKGGMALVELYDFVSGERTQDALADSMRRLVRMVQMTSATSAEVQAMMRREGAKDLDELSAVTYDQFKARLDEVRSVKATGVETLGTIVDFAGRSLPVFVLGPIGLPGLMAALGAYSTGMLVRKGLLGADYDLVSRANVSTLAGEVTMFGFDESKIENVITSLITPDLVKKWGARRLRPAARPRSPRACRTASSRPPPRWPRRRSRT